MLGNTRPRSGLCLPLWLVYTLQPGIWLNVFLTSPSRSAPTNYLVAALAAVVAVAIRWLLTPWMGHAFPLATLFSAVAFSVWFGGWRPALFTCVAGFIVCDLLFTPGLGVLGLQGTVNELVGIAVYLASCASIIVLGEAMRAAQQKLQLDQRDLSATNVALENRIEAQSLLAAIVASSDDAIISKTLDGIITSWNQGAERLFGYTAHEAIGQSILMLIPPDRQSEEAELIDKIRRGLRVEHLEVVRRTKDGRDLDISLTISPVHDRHGRVIGASKTARDITPQRLAMEALKEADRRKDEFLATLAHELRNPLAPLSSGLHILRAVEPDSDVAARAREIMERQVGQMVRLIDDLLDVARITTGKVELRCETLDLADAVRDAAETSRPLISEGGQTLTIVLPAIPIYVNADRTRLAQVFANLLNNSAKYSRPGQHITISLEEDDGEAVVRVRDAGIGIKPEVLPRIFDMFRQGELPGARSRGGLGIGLFLVKRIVELHSGAVEAHSEGPDQGCEFLVRIPVMAEVTKVASARVPAAPTAALSLRVLVVDDNEDAAESLSAMLAINGHKTLMAYDGPEALRAAESFKPDIVFLDIGLPTLDGHETARRIRREPWGRDMVLIALTGWGQREDRKRSQEAGFNHHMVKPADPLTVAQLLSSLQTSA